MTGSFHLAQCPPSSSVLHVAGFLSYMCMCVCVCVYIYTHTYTYIYKNNIFFIHSSINGHLGCFRILAIVNLLPGIQECGYLFEILISFPLIIYPAVWLLDHMAVLFLILGGTTKLFSIAAASFYLPTNSVQNVTISPHLTDLCYLFSFDNIHHNLFFFFKINFYWSIVDLQCCV